jgi:1-acyl-sn-glycerol-3-phosphate acyltransferase
VIIGPPLYAEGTGPRAIAELNDRAFAWVSQAQRDIASLDAQSQPQEAQEPA